MAAKIERIYLYRQLLSRCHGNRGLDFDEIATLTAIEGEFYRRGRRPPAGVRVQLKALLRGPGLCDVVKLVELGLTGAVCRQTPYVEEGSVIELVFDDDAGELSYRFKAQVEWLRDDVGDDFAVGLSFVGIPVCVRYGPASDGTYNLIHQIAA